MKIVEVHARYTKIMQKLKIPRENYKNHQNRKIIVRVTKILKFIEFHVSIMKIIEIIKFQVSIMKIIEILKFF